MSFEARLELFPETTTISSVDNFGQLFISGCDLSELAETYGTPLYIYDQASMDNALSIYRDALAQYYPGESAITYAGKAALFLALAQWTKRQDIWLDCTGIGETYVAKHAGLDRSRLLLHGVNKSDADLDAAVESVGVIVVDNLSELRRLVGLKTETMPDLWLRLRPGLAVDTHSYTQTGQEESKFGMDVDEILSAVHLSFQEDLPLTGLHFHQGSHFHDPSPLGPAIETVLDLSVHLRNETGWIPSHLSPGGGWGVAYHEDDLPQPPIESYVRYVSEQLRDGCHARGLPLPALHVEPGRSLVARAAVAIYRVGTIKQSAQRQWALLDGGMADNIRPSLYGVRYSALPVAEPKRPYAIDTWFGGPYCESGDLLIEGLSMPALEEGDLVAVPASGAYQLSMASNYNGALRPAIVWLADGEAKLVRRRERVEDLIDRDLSL